MTIDDHGGWSGVLGGLSSGADIGAAAAEAVLDVVLAGEATDAQLAAFVVALRQKGETVDEMTGLVRGHARCGGAAEPSAGHDRSGRRRRVRVGQSRGAQRLDDGELRRSWRGRHSLQAWESQGIVDVRVLRSPRGAGCRVEVGKADLEECVREVGLGFAFARTFHPAMRFAGPVRAELGIPTVFNILGPLSHPGRLTRQVVGVPDADLGHRMAEVLLATGSERAMVVTGDGGLDELSTTGPNVVHEIADGVITTSSISPADVGVAVAQHSDLHGGDAQVNADIARRMFAGETGPHRDIVVLNAAAGLVVAGIAADLVDGCERSDAAIDSGAAAERLDRLVALTKEQAARS